MNYKDMTTEEVAKILDEAQSELIRRQNVALLGDRLAQVQNEFRDSEILSRPEHGAKWKKPEEAEFAYGLGDVVSSGGGLREATAGVVICSPECEDHWADYTEPEDQDLPEEEATVKEWSEDKVDMRAGDLVSYGESVYRVKENHVTRPEWTPPTMPGLFGVVEDA